MECRWAGSVRRLTPSTQTIVSPVSWACQHSPQRPAGTAGLHHVTLLLRSADDLAATVSRVNTAGGAIKHHDAEVLMADPSGNHLLLTTVPPGV